MTRWAASRETWVQTRVLPASPWPWAGPFPTWSISPRGHGRVRIGADLSLPMETPPEGGLMPGPPLFPGFKPLGPGLASSLFYSGLSLAIPHPRGLASALTAQCPHPALCWAPLGGSRCPLAQCCGQPGLPLPPVFTGLCSSPLTKGSPAIPALQSNSSSLGKRLQGAGHLWGPWEPQILLFKHGQKGWLERGGVLIKTPRGGFHSGLQGFGGHGVSCCER